MPPNEVCWEHAARMILNINNDIGGGMIRSVCAMLLALAAPVSARAQQEHADAQAAALAPGGFRWLETPTPAAAQAGQAPVSIVVSLAEQRAYVLRGGRLIGITTVSTGARGHATPTGRFRILQKRPFHRSNLYSNAPMPFMQRLTWGGIALHAGPLPGYPASHGCIRLPRAFARTLYDLTEMGGEVTILAGPYAGPPPAPLPEPQIAANTRGLGDGWPGAAPRPQGPRIAVDLPDLGGAPFEVLTMPGPASQPAPLPAGGV